MKAIISLIASVVVFLLVLVWNYLMADFWKGFGGPDNLPPPGFRKIFIDGATKASPIYIICIICIIASITAIAKIRKRKNQNK